MTHADLLSEIDHDIQSANGLSEPGLRALRAVVELHHPKSSEYFPADVCVACSPDIDRWLAYPCPTIVAIQAVI
jgi:hypothetical protein